MSARWRALASSLSARIIALTVLALVVSQIVGYVSFRHDQADLAQRLVTDYLAQSVPSIDRTLAHVRAGEQRAAVQALSNRFATYDLTDHALACPPGARDQTATAATLSDTLGVASAGTQVCVGHGLIPDRPRRRAVALSVPRGPGRWLEIRAPMPHRGAGWAWHTLRNLAITLLIMSVVLIAVSRRMTRPLRDLAAAAERFGRGETIAPVAVRGADEMARSIAEFNRMQERIGRFVTERTQLIAALAHDLRTPITALRLRLEFLPADDNTRAMRATLDDLAAMSEATLTFMRAETASEPTRRIDLAALVDAVVEDYRAAEAPVTLIDGPAITLACRPTAIRRALRNIIDNALAYGESAELRLVARAQDVVIEIADRGPGIAAADRERVFDAFVRLEASRSRETGGAGLGLAIARSVVRGHGGDIALTDGRDGGLVVALRLPRAASGLPAA